MMNLYDKINNIKSKEELINFLDFLSKDTSNNKKEWQNDTIKDYLAAIALWIEDMEGYYENMNLPMPDNENWSFIATLFYVGKIYE